MKTLVCWAAALSLALPLGQAAAAWNATAIYGFSKASDARSAVGGLVEDSAGRLYGAASGGDHNQGAVFMLTPPGPGKTAWTESVLYSFAGGTADGAYPESPLIVDAAGRLFGVASSGGANNAGTVFEIIPPALGKSTSTERTLYDFDTVNRAIPQSALAQDVHGNLYFAAAPNSDSCFLSGCGIIVKLALPAKAGGAWKATTLHSFTTMANGSQPQAGLVLDDAGNIYGTTQIGGIGNDPFGDGVVFKLSAPNTGGTDWTEHVLYRFRGGIDGLGPSTNLVLDAAGNLYGTTIGGGVGSCRVLIFTGCGTVFALTRPAVEHTGWTERVLDRFTGNDGANPQAPISIDRAGNLYGSNLAEGTSRISIVFELNKPKNASNPWAQTVLMQVHHAASTVGSSFGPVVTLSEAGKVYVTLPFAGQTGAGIVYGLARP